VQAFDADGRVEVVEFLAGSQLIGVATVAPFAITWSNVAPGAYSLWARVTDDDGAVTVTAPVTVTVKQSDQPPTVSITTPVTGDVFLAPATVTIRASCSDPDGSVTRVEFLAGQTLLGVAAGPPFEFHWNNVPAGSYLLTARATDNAGATSTSAPVSVTVTVTASAPEPSPPVDAAPAFYQGVNLGGPALTIEGHGWLSQAAALRAGLILNSAASFSAEYSFPVIPSPDAATLKMLSSAVWKPGTVAGQGLSLVHPLPRGDYLVYVYLIENYRDAYRVLDLRLEGVTAAAAIGELPLGSWKRYGPYPVSVNDGKLNIDLVNAGRGDPGLAGYTIFRASSADGPPPATPTSEAAFYQAINFGGPALTIAGGRWMSHVEATTAGLVLNTSVLRHLDARHRRWSGPALDPADCERQI